MTTNSDIAQAFFSIIDSAALGYPIAYPTKSFTPPDSGHWLEVSFMPNSGIDQGLKSGTVLMQGLAQVNVCGRPDTGLIPLHNISEQVGALFPKNLVISGNVRVSKTPYNTDIIPLEDRIILPLTVMYSE